jgi:predicted membrane-bound dolichyl-phosphate-mannose-protein mannosyltransferase
MYRRLAMARRLSAIASPLALLAAVSLLSLGARVALLDQPCRSDCRAANDHLLVFDEVYYVNAARVIAGVVPPSNQKYASAPLGDDPNAEHPQLVKLLMAGSIELFGDNPFAWRLTSLLLGSVAILGMFALVSAAGGGRWPALAGATMMAADNLLLVHSRIGTLDVPTLAAMIWGVVLYLRGRPLAAGLVIGVGSCMKLVAPYALIVIALVELLRAGRRVPTRSALVRAGTCIATAAAAFLALLAILDRVAPPYDAASGTSLGFSPFRHLAHILSYGAGQSSPHGPHGIASYPWTWLVDYKPITYLNINPARPAPGLYGVHPAAHFLGMISPVVLLVGTPGVVFVLWELIRARRAPRRVESSVNEIPIVALAWFLGTFVPFVVLAVVFQRTSYLYYMVVVMPGLYLAGGYVLWRARRYRWLIALWWVALLAAVIIMYPFTPLP